MDAYETTDLIDQLVKAKIPKKTAAHLLNYVDKTQNEKTDFKLNVILWIMGLGFTILFTIITALHVYTNNRMDRMRSDISKVQLDISKMQLDISKTQSDISKLQLKISKMQSDILKMQSDVVEIKSILKNK